MTAPVAAPAGGRLNTGLRNSALRPVDPGRWEIGVSWQPELCVGGYGHSWCDDPPAFTPIPAEDTQSRDGYELVTTDSCSTFGTVGDLDRVSARATRQLEAQTSHLLEQAAWTGEIGGQALTNTLPFADPAATDVTANTATGIVSALSLLLKELADVAGSARAFFHVPSFVVPFLTFYGQVNRVGDTLLLGATDHVVVSGTGYPGTSPAGAEPADGTAWLYVTGPVALRLGEVVTNLGGTVDTATNMVAYQAARSAIHYWDPCVHLAALVCLPDPGPDCGV
jgi:hypothetical protein